METNEWLECQHSWVNSHCIVRCRWLPWHSNSWRSWRVFRWRRWWRLRGEGQVGGKSISKARENGCAVSNYGWWNGIDFPRCQGIHRHLQTQSIWHNCDVGLWSGIAWLHRVTQFETSVNNQAVDWVFFVFLPVYKLKRIVLHANQPLFDNTSRWLMGNWENESVDSQVTRQNNFFIVLKRSVMGEKRSHAFVVP